MGTFSCPKRGLSFNIPLYIFVSFLSSFLFIAVIGKQDYLANLFPEGLIIQQISYRP